MTSRRSFFKCLMGAVAASAMEVCGWKDSVGKVVRLLPNPAYENAMYQTWYTVGENSQKGRWHWQMINGPAPEFPQRWDYDGKTWTEIPPFIEES